LLTHIVVPAKAYSLYLRENYRLPSERGVGWTGSCVPRRRAARGGAIPSPHRRRALPARWIPRRKI